MNRDDTDVTQTTNRTQQNHQTQPPQERVCGQLMLVMPKSFSLPEQKEALDRLKSFNRERAQLILDELAARMKAETIRNPLGYLGALIKRERSGAFQPELAHQHARDREIRERNLAAQRLREQNPTVAAVTPRPPKQISPVPRTTYAEESMTNFTQIGQHIDLPNLLPRNPQEEDA